MKLNGNCGDEGEETCCGGGISMDRGVSAITGGGIGTGEGEAVAGTDGNATSGKGAEGNGADAGALGGGPDGEGSLGISGIGTLPGTSIVFRFLLPRLVMALCGVAVYEEISIDKEYNDHRDLPSEVRWQHQPLRQKHRLILPESAHFLC